MSNFLSMSTREQQRKQFDLDFATPEDRPISNGRGCTYYPTGAFRTIDGILAPPPQDKRDLKWNILKYWELREEKAVDDFENAKEEALANGGRIHKMVTIPKKTQKINGRLHYESEKEVRQQISESDTKRELLRLREEARHCMLRRADADEEYDNYRPKPSGPINAHLYPNSDHMNELRDIEL